MRGHSGHLVYYRLLTLRPLVAIVSPVTDMRQDLRVCDVLGRMLRQNAIVVLTVSKGMPLPMHDLQCLSIGRKRRGVEFAQTVAKTSSGSSRPLQEHVQGTLLRPSKLPR